VTMETALSFLVKAHGTDVIWLGSWLSIHKNITMNDSSQIINLPVASAGGEPVTNSYVDSHKPIITTWAEQNGVIENQKFEWSFGSGAEGRTHWHSGYTMMASGRILRMGLDGAAGNSPIPFEATVNVVMNGRQKEDYSVTIPRNHYSVACRFSTTLELFYRDRMKLRWTSGNPNVTSAICKSSYYFIIKMTVDKFSGRGIDDRSDVSLKFINKSFL